RTTSTICIEIVELVIYLVTVALAGVLLRPLLRRLPVPEWLARARRRGRPGVPVTAWLVTLILLGVLWLTGERRGLAGALLFGLWVAGPIAAGWITSLWFGRRSATP
ncbi:MAG: hypothetical protein H6R40_742, partial [Gemmatimonadetes bacterium]|nr:hypothetical protein [Gemmatimonadota bacterium]